MSVQHLNFINGEWVPGTDQAWLEVRPGIKVVDSSLMDVVKAVQAANKALSILSKTPEPASVRFETLGRLASLVESNANAFASALQADLGTPEASTLEFTIPFVLSTLRAAYPIARPVGLIGYIGPASDPLSCLVSRFAPAYAQGNAFIAKPSRYTGASTSLFARLAHEAGVSPGLFALLHGQGREVGVSLVQHPGISTLAVMGSTATGHAVALMAAENFKRVHYSLGAKNPVLVFANVDLDDVMKKVARICLGAHPSQAYKGSRLFIQESIFKSALEKLRAEFETLSAPPLVKARDREIFSASVTRAEKENGKALTSSGVGLFADLTNCSTLQQDEIMGPLVLAGSFKYAHEALKYANVSPYGRLAYIFENDVEKAKKVAEKIEVGSVFVNASSAVFGPLKTIPLLKGSGHQSEGGEALARFFSRESVVHVK